MTHPKPIRTAIAWRRTALLALLAGLVALPLLAPPASAADNPFRPDHPWIYQTVPGDTGTDYFYKILPESGQETLLLYMTVDGPGDTPNLGTTGTACVVGDNGRVSDHVCAFTANFVIEGDGEFVSFVPSLTGLGSVPDSATSFPPGQKQFGLSFVVGAQDAEPLEPGVVELGVLTVNSFSAFMKVTLVSGEAVRSETLEEIDMSTGQSLSSLIGDQMAPHTLAVSICDFPVRGQGLLVDCPGEEEEAAMPLLGVLALLGGGLLTALRFRSYRA